MIEHTYLNLVKTLIHSSKELIVIFEGDKLLLSNNSFNNFFNVNSIEEYQKNFKSIENSFALHPSYFNKDKILSGESWFESIMSLDEIDRVVSMLNKKYEPQAFSVNIDSVENFKIVTFVNITQSLVKRIMIENQSNIDKKSGAYAKQYFLQILPSYETAGVFNEKIIGLCFVELNSSDELDDENIKKFVDNLKSSIRHDDMLVRWSRNKFIVIYLANDEKRVKLVMDKLKEVISKTNINGVTYKVSSIWQKNRDSIKSMLATIT